MSDTLSPDPYSFVFRGHLTKDALDRVLDRGNTEDFADAEELLSFSFLDDRFLARAEVASRVYVAIAAFENSVRDLVRTTLIETHGEGWWEQCVSPKIRSAATSRMQTEEKARWHTPRGTDPLNYTMLPNLMSIIRQNEVEFSALLPNVEWAANVFDILERSRNVIMHSGSLSRRDMARVGTFLRDWSSQVYS